MKYRKIDPKIWNDERFNSLSDKAKLIFFFLLTHPHMTPVGAMRATTAGFAEELGWTVEAFREAFQEALSKAMVKHNPKAHYVSLPNFIKYNAPESPNVVTAWGKSMDDIPECREKDQLYHDLKALLKGYAKAFREAFDKAFAKPTIKAMPNQEQEQEQEQDKDLGVSKTPPSDLPLSASCPQEKIKTLYHEILPELPRVKVWDEKNQGYLRARWRSDKEYQSLDWWKEFFLRVKASDFLMGKTGKPFSPDLEWLVTKSNFDKILNGRYVNRNNNPLKGKVSDITAQNIESFQEWEPPSDGKEMFS